VDYLLRAGQVYHLPAAFRTRGWLHFMEMDYESSNADLNEAWQIAQRGPMKLDLADVHLHRARLFRDREELKKARVIIEECHYFRRTPELEDAEIAARNW